MKTGIAMWHYPHRTTIENIEYFAGQGIKTLGLNQSQLTDACEAGKGAELAQVIKKNDLTITLHGALTYSHSEEDVTDYKKRMDTVGEWQKKYGLLSVVSFDVFECTRDNITEYVRYALDNIPDCSIAVEDFGLTADERAQIEIFKNNERFGYLIDIGHMYMRLCGKSTRDDLTLFLNSPDECPACDNPGKEQFLKAFKSKEFPIKEIHLHNNDGKNDMHYFLNDGTLDIKMIAQVLDETGYDGVVTIESAPGFMFECKYPESDIRILEDVKYWEDICGGRI